ncbi:MAG: PA2169 family four-helix-bundle protein [Blastocatellia bacterium]
MNNDKAVSTLNDLIETLRDGQNGFKEAAENAQNPDLKTFFNQVSLERAQMVGELQQEVHALGQDPENSGSAAAALHRTWMDIKGTLTGRDDKAILNECERGEDSAVRTFQDALKDQDLPTNLRTLIDHQFRQVKLVHDRVKQMRDAQSAVSGR